MKTLTYITFLMAIIALILGGIAFTRTGGVDDLQSRLDVVEKDLIDLGDRVEGETQESLNELEIQEIILEAKSKLQQSKVEVEINFDYEAAVAAVENAQKDLARARETASESLQKQIDDLNDDLDVLKQDLEVEAVDVLDSLQAILEEWEVRLSGS